MGPVLAVCPASWSRWTVPGRFIVFNLAGTSIWCLLAEFYSLCSMRTFTLFISIPAMAVLTVMAMADRLQGDARLWRGVLIGATAGLIATAA